MLGTRIVVLRPASAKLLNQAELSLGRILKLVYQNVAELIIEPERKIRRLVISSERSVS